jgi:hypothetical protein
LFTDGTGADKTNGVGTYDDIFNNWSMVKN